MIYTNVDTIVLALSLIDGVGPKTISTLLEVIPSSDIVSLATMTIADLTRYGIPSGAAHKIVVGLQDRKKIDTELSLIDKHHVRWCTIATSEWYPSLLRQIYTPPSVLYWFGADLKSFNHAIAVVGSRDANQYAEQIVNRFVPALVSNDWSIISGGAIGADTMAHKTTIKSNGRTMAILGSGLLKPYPRVNTRLFDAIVESSGAVMSCFSLMTDPHPAHFPMRNRIIAGVTKGCIVVQAAQASGARITAQYALDEGRAVFAIPGSVLDPLSEGCHALIRDGAALVTQPSDIMAEFGDTFQPTTQSTTQSLSLPQDPLVILCTTSPKTVDELAQELECSFEEIQHKLFELQLEGKVEQQFTGKWVGC